ncbi:HK97-gp10 family putative phage morphogenesis protein [Phaeobacter gallaeciensis]|uniref:hypothetical protein n=1 Tax=Phaeobacter gallaeciensis TaxID=60890 RepID=UPI0003D6B376|nr:hypothetical protein [Phaeobacter gallaeciensis]AHD12145.1 hypothetical protein Gal_04441 [Phaeobacter gallaeciensis DSM 26640]ATE95329.1 phage protein, HK97 gp10 family [Phaeobacter gallaeciensis]
MSKAKGFSAARRKSARRNSRHSKAVADGISSTVDEVHRAGLQNMDGMVKHKSGKLRRGYRKRLRKKGLQGLVGYVSAAARRSAFYARFVHDGTAKTKPYPYHDNAVLEYEGRHRTRMRAANAVALDERASPSGTGRSGGGKERSIT